MFRQPLARRLELMRVQLRREAKNLFKIQLGRFLYQPDFRQRGVILDLEFLDAEGITALLCGFG